MEAQIPMVKGVKNLSKYTLEVRNICESLVARSERAEFMDVNEVIKLARPNIFNFDYPKWDSEYNEMLEEKILRTYYMREIGVETYGLFKLRLQVKLNDIMPYYNKLYESEKLKFDPLKEIDLTTVSTKDIESNYEKLIDTILKDVMARTAGITKTGSETLAVDGSETDTKNIQKTHTEDLKREGTENKKLFSNTSSEERSDGDSTTSGGGSHEEWDLYSDTPQGSSSFANLSDNDYITNARRKTGSNTSRDVNEYGYVKNQDSDGNVNEHNVNDVSEDNTITDTASITNAKLFDKTNDRTTNLNENQTEDITKDKTDNTIETNTKNAKEQFTQTMTGKNSVKSYSALVKEYRHTFLNIDRMVIEEMGDLFMNLW